MRNRNNLSPDFGARYYRVVEPFSVFCANRMYLSEALVGASQAYGNIFDLVQLHLGDQVHDIPHGVFVQQADESYMEAHAHVSLKGILDAAQDTHEEWPLDCLVEISEWVPGAREYPVIVKGPVGIKIGDGIDYIDCAEEAVETRDDKLYPKEARKA